MEMSYPAGIAACIDRGEPAFRGAHAQNDPFRPPV
jgi:hypothetical protein